MLAKHEILGTLARHRDALRRCGVRRLGLFGSFARGEQRPDSDLDFVVGEKLPRLEQRVREILRALADT